jgi:hypothetical protein
MRPRPRNRSGVKDSRERAAEIRNPKPEVRSQKSEVSRLASCFTLKTALGINRKERKERKEMSL